MEEVLGRELEYTRLGPLRVSVVGLGLWQAGSRLWGTKGSARNWAFRVIEEALERGVNLYDTAEIYGWGESERLLGQALKEAGTGGDVVVATKVGGFRTTRYTILKAARGSARRLGRPPDIIQHHWPPPVHSRLCWVARGLEEAVERGLAHHVGLSNYPARLLEGILHCFHRLEPVSIQVQYSLAYRSPENKLIPLARRRGLGVIAWSPLAKGALAGLRQAQTGAQKGDPVFREASRDEGLQEALEAVAKRYGVTKAQVALAWIIAKGVVPIPGTRRPERVREYARASSIRLSKSDVDLLDGASARYLYRWGRSYKSLQWLRLMPSPLQYLAIRLAGGV